MSADEEGASDTALAAADGSGIFFFLCYINGIFLAGERVRDDSTTLVGDIGGIPPHRKMEWQLEKCRG